jgi:hypothetical protein
MIAQPPNLKELFGDRFKIAHDEAASSAERDDPWMMQIPCRGPGVAIYPHGTGVLAVECDNRPGIAKRLTDMGLRLHQNGDCDRTFLFTLDQFEEVAAIVKPRQRRILKEEQRSRFIAAGTGYRYVSASKSASDPPKVVLKCQRPGNRLGRHASRLRILEHQEQAP